MTENVPVCLTYDILLLLYFYVTMITLFGASLVENVETIV